MASFRQRKVLPKVSTKPMERRQVKRLEHPMGNQAQNALYRREQAKIDGLRLKPDLKPFHRQM